MLAMKEFTHGENCFHSVTSNRASCNQYAEDECDRGSSPLIPLKSLFSGADSWARGNCSFFYLAAFSAERDAKSLYGRHLAFN